MADEADPRQRVATNQAPPLLGHDPVAGDPSPRSPALAASARSGNRSDEVRSHPSWHWLLERGVDYGLQAAPWTATEPWPHLRRAVGFVAWSQVEPGHGCPLSMTYAAVPALQADPLLAKEWTPSLAATAYEPGLRWHGDKAGALAGMG